MQRRTPNKEFQNKIKKGDTIIITNSKDKDLEVVFIGYKRCGYQNDYDCKECNGYVCFKINNKQEDWGCLRSTHNKDRRLTIRAYIKEEDFLKEDEFYIKDI